MSLPKEGPIGMTSRNDKKYIHLDFDDTITCKQFKAFSSIQVMDVYIPLSNLFKYGWEWVI